MKTKPADESLIAPPQDNTLLKWRMLTEPQQQSLLNRPAHASASIQKMLKPGEGMEPVAEKVLDLLEGMPAIAKALKLEVPALRARFAERKELSQYEGTTYKLYRRAAENRMACDSDLYGALLKVNRFVNAADDAGLASDFSELVKWVAATHRHAADATQEQNASDKPDEKKAQTEEAPAPKA